MEYFVQQFINGVTLGSIYGLIAIGYTMVFGIIGMVNFAHGDVFMLSAFIALMVFLIVTTWLGIGSVVVALIAMLLISMVLTGAWNWAIEKVAYRPLRGSFRLAPLISAIGVSIVLSNFVQVAQDPRNKPIPPIVRDVYTVYHGATSSITLSLKQIIIVLVTASCSRSSGTSCRRRRSAAPSAPASRTARWRRWSASTSTRLSPSPSSWALRSPRSPARCS